jgi:hypothetical protein
MILLMTFSKCFGFCFGRWCPAPCVERYVGMLNLQKSERNVSARHRFYS